MAVTTSACADTQAPTAPTNVTASTRTTTSIALTWAPATDNVGVAGYGVYNGANLVNTTAGTTGIVSGLTCGTNYTLAVDAFDATGNSSPKTTMMVSTLPCADTTAPTVTMTAPTNGSTVTGTINASANATDNVGVTRVEFFRDGVSLGSDTSSPYSIAFNTTTVANGSHTFGARAYDSAGNVGNATNVTVTVSNTAPPPSSSGAVKQTIANGSTISNLNNWRGVYDANGDGGRGRPRLDPVPDRRQPGAVRDQRTRSVTPSPTAPSPPQRPAHLPGTRPQRQRHPARHQHRHRHRRQQQHLHRRRRAPRAARSLPTRTRRAPVCRPGQR